MSLSEKAGFRKKVTGDELPKFIRSVRNEAIREGCGITIVCIGTDRSSGDSLGPLVGTMLSDKGVAGVIGTLDRPCDAATLKARLNEIPAGTKVIAVDACLGLSTSVGLYQISDSPIEPGSSVGRDLPCVGHYSIAAIVNVDGVRKYQILQNTSLHRVMTMAKEIAGAIQKVFLER